MNRTRETSRSLQMRFGRSKILAKPFFTNAYGRTRAQAVSHYQGLCLQEVAYFCRKVDTVSKFSRLPLGERILYQASAEVGPLLDGMERAVKVKEINSMIAISRELRSRSGVVLALAVLSVVLCSTIVPAVPQDQPGRSTFNTSCASCHGRNGTSTPVGKSLNAPDLNSPAVQNESDAQLRQIIDKGKGNMPGFKSSLSEDQIDALVTYIRTLAKPQQ